VFVVVNLTLFNLLPYIRMF